MAFIWRKEELEKEKNASELILPQSEKPKHEGITILYFALLVGILIFGAAKNWLFTGILLGGLILILYRWFKKEEIISWIGQTWTLGKQIFPLLLVGVFFAGMMKVLLPQTIVQNLVGGNGFFANLIASIFGAFMYFSTLTEVPIMRALMDLGMGKGPVLSMLLADPALSLPSTIVLIRIIGWKKALVYNFLVVIIATITGMAFGALF